MDNKDTLMDAKQVCTYIKVSISCLDRMIIENEFCHADFVITQHKKRLWKLSTVQEFLEQNCKNPRKEQTA
ncbi:MAG: hypothetical protein K2Y14_06795 [Burkholderiales bacterium]|nr:hypothetical protein [Burkholderiales bacterium]